MFRHKNIFLLISVIFLFSACMGSGTGVKTSQSSENSRPGWTTAPPRHAGYIFGVGSVETYGNTRTAIQRAHESARVDLLSQLRVTVSGDMQTSVRAEGDESRFTSIQKIVQQQTSSRVEEIEMTGMEITETWVNPSETEVWALARMNRAKTESELIFALEDIEDKLLQRGTGSGTTLSRIRHIFPSLKELEERRHLIHQLNFLSAGQKISERKNSRQVDALQTEIQDLLASLTIRLEPENDDAIQMKGILAQTLTSMGFNIHDQNPDLLISLSITMTPVQRNQLHHVVSQARGQVKNPQGRILYALQESGRSSSSDAAIASNKAVEDMARKLADILAAGLFQNI
ncbi:LPP20 family lipoprotein [Desulfobotulus mexicanus]|uniref:LPP20 family lipoprotein n=1 Tax=Desulfobotulus mexicanus TaxID=2586642 RepID=A0A5Q4VFC7_9BACT|nr:LPP20 family lipoprotein [Desulfobotulus mexicanus]TYT75586.1 hypothetical protein FIM25_03875 [Desulfobotulus mexicanus]